MSGRIGRTSGGAKVSKLSSENWDNEPIGGGRRSVDSSLSLKLSEKFVEFSTSPSSKTCCSCCCSEELLLFLLTLLVIVVLLWICPSLVSSSFSFPPTVRLLALKFETVILSTMLTPLSSSFPWGVRWWWSALVKAEAPNITTKVRIAIKNFIFQPDRCRRGPLRRRKPQNFNKERQSVLTQSGLAKKSL